MRHRFKEACPIPLLGTMLLGFVLRLSIFAGIAGKDDTTYLASALNILAGEKLNIDLWTTRLGIILPAAAFMRIFGVSEWKAIAYPLLLSIAQIGLVFRLGELLFDRTVGLFAAWLIAVYVPDIRWSTTLMGDIPAAFWSGASAYLFFRTLKNQVSGRAVPGSFLFSGLALGIAYMAKEYVVLIGVTYLIALMWHRRHLRSRNLICFGIGFLFSFISELVLLRYFAGNSLARISCFLRLRQDYLGKALPLFTWIYYELGHLSPLSDGYIFFHVFGFSIFYLYRRGMPSQIRLLLIWSAMALSPPFIFNFGFLNPERYWVIANCPMSLIMAYAIREGALQIAAIEPRRPWILSALAVFTAFSLFLACLATPWIEKALSHMVLPVRWWTLGGLYHAMAQETAALMASVAALTLLVLLWLIFRGRLAKDIPALRSPKFLLTAAACFFAVYAVVHLKLLGGVGATDMKQISRFLFVNTSSRDIVYSDSITIANLSNLYKLNNHIGMLKSLGAMADEDVLPLRNVSDAYLVINERCIGASRLDGAPNFQRLNRWLKEGFPRDWKVLTHMPSEYENRGIWVLRISNALES